MHSSHPKFQIVIAAALSWAITCNAQTTTFKNPGIEPPLGFNVLRGQPIRLFDGSSLKGWETRDGDVPENWDATNGNLHRKSGGGDLYHQHWFQDFDFQFEWKIQSGGNSGVKYRVRRFGKQMLGCEYQLQDDQGRDHTRQSTGALYGVFEPTPNKKAPTIGDWNRSRIIVCGQQMEHWLNGERILRVTAGDARWWARVQKSKFRNREGFGLNREGRIFLQDHGNPVWFRNLVLTPLDSDQPAIIGAAESPTAVGGD